MSGLWIGVIAAAVAGAIALGIWQLMIAEGAYLGPRMVARTYDWVARRYDAIKQFDARDEDWCVAGPLLQAMAGVRRPLLLDVATGTGRLPIALLRNRFPGQIVGLDLSWGMLRQARAKLDLYSERVRLVWQDADRLPFADDTFDAVSCLEALEFLPRPREALAEMVRVLAPGGILFVTNRVGREARLLPGRALSRSQFEQALNAQALQEIRVWPWQVDYDLAAARKSGGRRPERGAEAPLLGLFHCPRCAGELQQGPAGLSCPACRRVYPIRQGIACLADGGKRGSPA